MASLVAIDWAYINGDTESNYNNGVEVMKFNSALLMSMLEEPQGEDYSDEQLNRVIQSLEAEINANMLEEDHDLTAMELHEFVAYDEDGENCLVSMEFKWPDNMELVPFLPSDDTNWIMDHCEYELNDFVEYEAVCDYSQICNVEEPCFSSLWQETYL